MKKKSVHTTSLFPFFSSKIAFLPQNFVRFRPDTSQQPKFPVSSRVRWSWYCAGDFAQWNIEHKGDYDDSIHAGITTEYYLEYDRRERIGVLFSIRKSQQEFAQPKENERERERERESLYIINRHTFSQRNLNVTPR